LHIVGKYIKWYSHYGKWYVNSSKVKRKLDTPVLPALGSLRQEDHKLEATLDYILRPCLKNN
jgi:hypothetical protein